MMKQKSWLVTIGREIVEWLFNKDRREIETAIVSLKNNRA